MGVIEEGLMIGLWIDLILYDLCICGGWGDRWRYRLTR